MSFSIGWFYLYVVLYWLVHLLKLSHKIDATLKFKSKKVLYRCISRSRSLNKLTGLKSFRLTTLLWIREGKQIKRQLEAESFEANPPYAKGRGVRPHAETGGLESRLKRNTVVRRSSRERVTKKSTTVLPTGISLPLSLYTANPWPFQSNSLLVKARTGNFVLRAALLLGVSTTTSRARSPTLHQLFSICNILSVVAVSARSRVRGGKCS